VDVGDNDFRLRQDAAAFERLSCRPIPAEGIGLYEHPLRASWPVDATLSVLLE